MIPAAGLLLDDAFFENQWPAISAGLPQVLAAKTSGQLREALQQISADPNFHCVRAGKPDFEPVLDEIPEADEFFNIVLPTIVSLAELATRFKEKDVPILVAGRNATAAFTYSETATLLALAFLGLLPNGASMTPLYFPKDGCGFPPNTEKLRCFLQYFHHVGSAMEGTGEVWISRACADTSLTTESLMSDTTRLCQCLVQDLRKPIYNSDTYLHVDFANASVGGGIFLNAPGATAQEEITFATHPELSLATVLSEPLNDDEALLICGARRFSHHAGFLDTFCYVGAVQEDEHMFSKDVVQIVVDARMYDGAGVGSPYRHDHLFQVEDALRDIRKAICGFRAAKLAFPDRHSCATGNWGCGAFGGAPAVKLFVQWVAASLAGLKGLEYHPWDDSVLFQFMRSAETMELFSQATVGDLWTAVTAAAPMQTSLSNEARRYPEDGADFLRSVLDKLKSG